MITPKIKNHSSLILEKAVVHESHEKHKIIQRMCAMRYNPAGGPPSPCKRLFSFVPFVFFVDQWPFSGLKWAKKTYCRRARLALFSMELGASNAPLSITDAPHIHRSLPSIPNKDDNVLDISENRRTAKVKDLARFNDASAPDVATAYFLPHIRIRV